VNTLHEREYIGQGLSFPAQLTPRGSLTLVSGHTEIEQAIRIILGTVPGERKMRPTFGCRAWELVFDSNHGATQALMALYVREALAMWEPRIDVKDVFAYRDPDHDGGMMVDIRYEIKANHDPRALVYPFFIETEP
jgi:uncharacterized protein